MQPAHFCAKLAITDYCVQLNPLQPSKGKKISCCIYNNSTEITLGTNDRLQENLFYHYTVTAVNDIGNESSIVLQLTLIAMPHS